jgi:hypothetical protein
MPTPPGFASCSYEIRHSTMSRSAYLTFGVDCTDTDPNLVASKARTTFALATGLGSIIDLNASLVSTRASLGTDGGEDLVGVDSTVVPCTKGLTSYPPNCAALVHKRTARGGRRGRGRMYIPWTVAIGDASEAGVIIAGTVNSITTACTNWLTAMAASGPGPVVLLHRPSGPLVSPPTTPGAPNVVTSMSCDSLIATQRRRLGR